MSWNCRLMKRREGDVTVFAIHDVYYDAAGKINGYTADPVYPIGETWAEFQNSFTLYQKAAQSLKRDVLDFDALESEARKEATP